MPKKKKIQYVLWTKTLVISTKNHAIKISMMQSTNSMLEIFMCTNATLNLKIFNKELDFLLRAYYKNDIDKNFSCKKTSRQIWQKVNVGENEEIDRRKNKLLKRGGCLILYCLEYKTDISIL